MGRSGGAYLGRKRRWNNRQPDGEDQPERGIPGVFMFYRFFYLLILCVTCANPDLTFQATARTRSQSFDSETTISVALTGAASFAKAARR
jgi:hypothetical protein